MKSFCFLKDCDNFNGDFDCILHYSKIVNEAQQKIITHYNAMRSRMEEVLNDNVNYEETAKKKCKNQFDALYGLIKNRVEGIGGSESPSSSLGSRNSSQKTVKRASGGGKENSPTKKTRLKSSRSSKELFKDISIDSRPPKEKRTKQTKLPFFTTSSAKKRCSHDVLNDDDDMTYCEEIERGFINPNAVLANKSAQDTPDIFNFGTLENFHNRKSKEKVSTAVENSKELTPQKVLGIKIKTEKKDDKSFTTPLSPDLFLSDLSNSNNSVIFIEPPEKEVISISDRTYNPSRDLLQEIQKEIKQSRNKLYEDSDPIPTPPKVPVEERDAYANECMDCQIFYDNIVEKKSLSEANTEINNCPIECDGWKARCRKLRKDNKSRKNGMVIIKCNSKFARRRKEDTVNETAPGFWDLEVEPRKSKPLFRKQKNENYETPDL
ncbi:unnamed protein product [Chironomus riparius]|uniref:Uncharacterized protein n=1 Tax=Chironomus riparius TaxID=315576 RepID=A0A9N9RTK1_9DIPT|nr:unnamed protein product [Chironomus riparius]